MPVDLGISNAVIQAFLAGRAQKQQKEQFEAESEERRAAREEQAKQNAELLKQRQEEFKIEQAARQATQDIAMLSAKQKMAQDITETGITPPDIKTTVPKFSMPNIQDPMLPADMPIPQDMTGIPQGMMEVEHPVLGKLRIPTHETFIKQKSQDVEIMEGPKRETARQLQEAETKRQEAIEKLKQIQEDEQKGLDRDQKQLDRENALEIAKINAASRLKAALARGVNARTATQAAGFARSFETNDITRRLNIIRSQKEYAEGISKSATGPDDTGLIVALVKANDPNRVTETEFEIAQRSGQSLAQQYGFKLRNLTNRETQFLTPKARADMKATIKQRYEAEEKVFNNFKNETSKKFKNIGEDPADWLIDFTASGGQKIIFKAPNGKEYSFDTQEQLDAFKKSAGIP